MSDFLFLPMDRAHSRFGNEDMTWQKGWPGDGRRKLKRHPRSSFSASKLHESFNFVVEVTFYSFLTPDFHFGQMFFKEKTAPDQIAK